MIIKSNKYWPFAKILLSSFLISLMFSVFAGIVSDKAFWFVFVYSFFMVIIPIAILNLILFLLLKLEIRFIRTINRIKLLWLSHLLLLFLVLLSLILNYLKMVDFDFIYIIGVFGGTLLAFIWINKLVGVFEHK